MEFAVFAFGGLLLLTGIIGGGFEVRELRIPHVPGFPRVVAAAVGVLFIAIGIGMVGEQVDVESSRVEQTSEVEVAAPPVSFTISDELGGSQLSEQVVVVIDGSVVGTLVVNPDFPTQTISASVPEPGPHSYSLEAVARFTNGRVLSGVGQGTVQVVSGARFDVVGSISGNTWMLSLIAA